MLPKNLIPEGLTYFIAGGYAACPALASDIDVWVTVPIEDPLDPLTSMMKARGALFGHLTFQGFDFTEENVPHSKADRYISGTDLMVWKLARINTSTPIHIMITEGTVDEVLEGFDISTHQVALTQDRGVVKGSGWTPITQYPRVLIWTLKTLDRLQKIVTRYKVYNQSTDNPTNPKEVAPIG